MPLNDYRSLQFFHSLELSLVVDSLLKSTPNSVVHGIKIRAIWRPHVKFNEVDELFVSFTILCYEIDIFMCCLFSKTTVALTVFVLLGSVVI